MSGRERLEGRAGRQAVSGGDTTPDGLLLARKDGRLAFIYIIHLPLLLCVWLRRPPFWGVTHLSHDYRKARSEPEKDGLRPALP